MGNDNVCSLILISILIGVFGLAFVVKRVEASSTIYIRNDGSVDPLDGRILNSDNMTYVFSSNINDSVVVERNSIVIDGAGYLLSGPANSYSVGIDLSQRFNVTVKNLEIVSFGFGVKLNYSLNVTLIGNRISSEYLGKGVVLQDSSGNDITGNWFETNRESIQVYGASSHNVISGNNITRSDYGIIMLSSDNTMFGNNITCSDCSLYAYGSNRISIVGNNITHNRNESGHGAWGLHIMNCNSSSVVGNNLTDNQIGFEMHDSYGNLILGNNMSRNSGTAHFDGSGHIFSGNNFENNSWTGLIVSGAANSSVIGNNFVGNSDAAIQLGGSYITIAENNITNTKKSIIDRAYAIDGSGLSHCVISKNNMRGNGDSVSFQQISDTQFSDNYLCDNDGLGLYVLVASNCIFSRNHIADSVDCGIKTRGCNNSLFTENDIGNNSLGVSLELSYDNRFFHNSFVNNTQQAYTADSANYWDDGYPSGGNYWSDDVTGDEYQGSNQTIIGSDGVCDQEYFLDANNTDHYPLIGKYTRFNATSEHYVETLCNSQISDFQFNGTAISFDVSSNNETIGFCRICIPAALMNIPYKVFVNGTEVSYSLLLLSNETHNYLYFNFTHSIQEVVIIPEFPAFSILPLFVVTTLLAVNVYKRKRSAWLRSTYVS